MFILDRRIVVDRILSVEARYNLKHSDMARKLNLSYHTFYAYIRIDRSKTLPPLEVLANISIIFDVTVDWLIGLSEEGGI